MPVKGPVFLDYGQAALGCGSKPKRMSDRFDPLM